MDRVPDNSQLPAPYQPASNTQRYKTRVSWTRLILCLLAVICYISFGAQSNIVETIAFAITLWSAFLIDITPLKRIDDFDEIFVKSWKSHRLPNLGKLSTRIQHIFPWLRRLIAVILLSTMIFLAFQQPLALATETLRDHSCIQWNLPLTCRSGQGIDTILTSQGYSVRVGLIKDIQDGGPFDQSYLQEEEAHIENLIFAENATACQPAIAHTTIIVATFLNRSVNDMSTSAKIGIQDLQGAYLMQQEHNKNSAHHTKICLVIANIGESTSDTLESTLEPVMERIMLYARNDSTFGGIVGLPFSSPAINGLKWRDLWNQSHIPVISPSASSTELNSSYNFWRIALSDDEQTRVITDFLIEAFQTQKLNSKPLMGILIDKNDPYSQSLSTSLITTINDEVANVEPTEYLYTVNNPRSVRAAVDKAVAENVNYLFLAGYSAALIHVTERLEEIRIEIDMGLRGDTTLPSAIFGGDGIYDMSLSTGPYFIPIFSTVYASPLPVQNPLVSRYTEIFEGGLTSGDISLIPPQVVLAYTALKAFSVAIDNLTQDEEILTPQTIAEALSIITFTGPGDERISFTGQEHSNPRNKTIYVLCADTDGTLKLAAHKEIGQRLQLDMSTVHLCR